MSKFFFSGSVSAKLDSKNRFVLPQHMRYGLIENGSLEFTLCLGLGGTLSIYKKSDVEKIIENFKNKQNVIKYQKFFTIFFSTLHNTTCDKLGRIVIPQILKKLTNIKTDIIIAGVLNKVEIWPQRSYEEIMSLFLDDNKDEKSSLSKIAEEVFDCLEEKEKSDNLSEEEQMEYEKI